MIKTAIVILNWNGRNFLEQFLPSLERFSQGDRVQIIVADNGSTDDSLSFLSTNYPAIRQIVFDRNWGFAEGYNRALAQVDSEYYVLLNSDVEVTEGWLEPLVRMMDSDISIAAVMPKLRSYAERDSFEYAGAAGGFIDALGYPFCRGRILQSVEKDEGQYDTAREIFWATGACMFVRAKYYWDLGGLDSDFFAHQEEIDLCWRMKLAGYRIMIEPKSMVYHVGGGTLAADSPRKVFLNFRNNLAMLYKNLSENSLEFILFLRMCLDGISALVFLAQGKREYFDAVWDAHSEFRKMIPQLKQKRKRVQEIKKQKATQIYDGSVVLNYYLGDKKFSNFKL